MNTDTPSRLLGEVDGPKPLRAIDGRVALQGWCLISGCAELPEVRLNTDAGHLGVTSRHPRPDVQNLLSAEPGAAQSGFLIAGRLSPGVWLARLEGRLSDGPWQTLRTFTLIVETPPLAADIESPLPTGPVVDRVHVEGWALHPEQAVQALVLRYGHQEIPCDVGRSRDDLPALSPGSPHAARAGFKSRVILSAGLGPLRLKARLADGSVAVVRTSLEIAVLADENHGAEIDLAGARVPLAASAPATAIPPSVPAERPLNLLFILPGSFASNSALHVAALANELAACGHDCAVAVSHDLATLAHHRTAAFRGLLHADASDGVKFADGRGPDLIHAWTTRENVRRLTVALRPRHRSRVVVHLEDHEQEILALSLGRPAADLEKLPPAELERLIPPDLSHPVHGREFLAQADAVTVITDRLRELVPSGQRCHTIRPAADARYFRPLPRPDEFRRVLDLHPDETVLFYHGNVHAANAAEVRALYAAVVQLNRSGRPVTLIRTGRDAVDFLGALGPEAALHVLSLGQILHHHHLPSLMALADIFVQPGQADAFNDYRFPSKLPEFFAIGRPVILPRTNLGATVRHGVDAYVLDRADAAGIAAAVAELSRDRALSARLAQGALAFAAEHFSWQRSAAALARFYGELSA